MSQIDDMIEFVIDYTSVKEVKADTDIYDDLHLVGDDFHDFIHVYAQKYEVDMSEYLWYFHGDEEGISLGGMFFEPPYARVKRIPVTPELLAVFAANTKWKIDYPAHHIPERRYHLLINLIISGVLLLGLGVLLICKYTR
ncbi:DUF1493 family protein [Pontibacter harenae]|uniref:DUF1493 family protein n=1 Tax=Pontibacter harenae TaxID=2894083 RepID=UPI001E2A76D7|nr:DUF1493 family protein [Pontibacter harenae]MCC9166897.1 DUF1493 family protein [Pontibacter harenae]